MSAGKGRFKEVTFLDVLHFVFMLFEGLFAMGSGHRRAGSLVLSRAQRGLRGAGEGCDPLNLRGGNVLYGSLHIEDGYPLLSHCQLSAAGAWEPVFVYCHTFYAF
jgi:hypothetical protein